MTNARQTTSAEKIRLFVETPLTGNSPIHANAAQSHYLNHVMRLKVGDKVELFNGHDGAWWATINQIGKKNCQLLPVRKVSDQCCDADLWLLFAPIKRLRIDYLVEKATELGVAVLQPVKTRRTNSARVNPDRLRMHCIEAAEQTGRLTVPELRPLALLETLIENWDDQRKILFCDEGACGEESKVPLSETLRNRENAPWAILVGPEGGFDTRERVALLDKPFVVPITLGPRMLRADTAAIAALSLWQSYLGDW